METARAMLPVALCIVPSHDQAERMVERLKSKDIEEILVMLHHTAVSEVHPVEGLKQVDSDPPRSSAVRGAMAGAMIGGLGAVAGLVIPGVGLMVFAAAPVAAVAGAIVGAIAGAAGHTVETGEIRTIKDFGIPGSQLAEYRRRLEAGNYLVAVHTSDEDKLARASEVFAEMGGEHIDVFRRRPEIS